MGWSCVRVMGKWEDVEWMRGEVAAAVYVWYCPPQPGLWNRRASVPLSRAGRLVAEGRDKALRLGLNTPSVIEDTGKFLFPQTAVPCSWGLLPQRLVELVVLLSPSHDLYPWRQLLRSGQELEAACYCWEGS